ncbi:3-hydroxyacyl-CoA dehydrogenase NAD-binding domain-containing protein [Pseudoduganella lutea]|uniref:3-hydroxyacyl-CoA dehydrogenase NAD binding domain-containing protein n=1 Tax=Pseudoduganella lutea TaxID=321985 RepID=A0A4P6KTG3_9BURK|nr:3-hydroxyacyl-CoA dehydrogenase NAD-binding domain-containing protein [Pseudoduganella lutea]QBE61835.1 hypothetical protein EWM63_01530 [Pseudoduganella lutea]
MSKLNCAPAATDHIAHDAPRAIGRVGIMGATATSAGIVIDLLDADIPVTVYDLTRDSLGDVFASVRSRYEQSVAAGETTAHQRDLRMALLATTVNLHHLKDCDVIIDALGTDNDARAGLVRRLNEVVKPDAVVLTCPSNLDVYAIANYARHLGNVLGMQLPAATDVMQSWEFVPAKATSARTLATATALARSVNRSSAMVAGH